MRRRNRQYLRPDGPPTWLDYAATAIFWTVVIGWPAFIVIYRWLH